ncbi:MAG: Glycogen synthase [Candidatus Anoxychlamydiales bacterium]|nr:Glycogen synthase [Candidatus Anoxychlamydiales bacterium]
MKKICIDARMIESAGIGTYLKSILKNLKEKVLEKEKFKIFLIVNSKVKEKKLEAYKWLSKNFELIFLDAPIYSIKEQILLPFKIPKCDLFFSPHFNIPIFPIRAKKRLVTIHDVYHLAFFSKLKFLEKIYAKFFIHKAAMQSDKIITVSNFSKSEILKYTKAKPDKIEVIYNTLNPIFLNKTKITDLKKNKKKIDKYKIPKKYFLFVGSLKSHKNLLNLIKAYEEMEKEYPDVYLVIVGRSKNLKNSIDIQEILDRNKTLSKKIKIISDLKDEDLASIYEKAIALVFPSYYEGFGYPPLEAMSMKCPVIASNRASIPEVCLSAALYIEPLDHKSIFNGMKKMIEDKDFRKELIQKGLKRVKYFTTNDNFINKHIEQIKKLL